MRKTKRNGSFFLCLLINMLLNIEGIIPAVILLVLHFWLGISIWWAAFALGAWIVGIIVWMRFIGWAGRVGSMPDMPKENKNPYSAKGAEKYPK